MAKGFEEHYLLAKQYYEKHGNLLIDRDYVTEDGTKLGRWIVEQRRNYNQKKLSKERIEKLEAIGMVWNLKEYKWNLYYEKAKEYYIKNGNLLVPERYVTEDGFELGVWIVGLRQKRKRLSKIQKRKLNKIHMIWDVNNYLFNEHYKLAEAYFNHYGNLLVPRNFKTKDGITYDKNGFDLGVWIFDLRNARKGIGTSRLTKYQIRKLNKIKMVWNLSEHKWKENINAAKKYKEKHNNLDVSINYVTEDGIKLGRRLDGIKKSKTKDEKKTKTLKKMGYELGNKRESKWLKIYALAVNYYKKYGNLNIPADFKTKDGITYDKDGINLGFWIETQRRRNKKGMLSEERRALLDKIHMIWEVNLVEVQSRINEKKWKEKFELAKNYKKQYGDLYIPKDFNTFNGIDKDINGTRMGSWIETQRSAYRGTNLFKLTDDMIKSLDENEMDWFNNKDEKYQKEIINEKNKTRKKIEILNRFRSVLLSYDGNTLPSMEEINEAFIKQLKLK